MATLQITFVSESAGYQNSLGWYNKRTGEAGIIWKNTNDDGPHAAISAGTTATLDVNQADIDAGNFGFFIIPDGASIYGSGAHSPLNGPLSFSVNGNGDGVIRDAHGHKLKGEQNEIIFTDKSLNKHNVDYTSDGSGTNASAVNADQADGITGRIAFEDLVKHGDRDFNDLVIDVQVAPPANQPPVVNDQAFGIAENSAAGTLVGQVVASDPDAGQSLSYAIVGGNANGAFAINASTGAVTVADSSKLDFENPELDGYSLTVQVTDNGTGSLTDTAVVTVSVTDVNEAPVAGNDVLAVDAIEDVALVIPAASLLANDTDPDAGASKSIISVGGAAHGAVSLNGDGDVVFAPASGYSGPASFTYTMSDGALTSTATVSLTVIAAADAPTLVVADASSTGDGAIGLSVSAALVDTDGSESLGIEISGVPSGWTLSAGTVDPETGVYSLTASDLGSLAITPPPGTIGTISLTVTARATEASNGDTASSSGNLNISVANGTPGNDVLVGGPGNDVIDALAGNDLLIGLGGNDQLFGSEGNDTLSGGAGNDILDGGIIADFQSAVGFNDLDTADYSAAAGAVNVNLATGTASDGEGGSDTLIGIERIVGSAFDDTLTGSDTTFSERYLGGAGNDTINGGLFNDRAEYMGATAGIAVNMTAISASSGTVTGDASVGTDTLIGVEQVIGTDFGDTYSALGYLSPSAPGGVASNFNEFEGAGGNDSITGNGGTRLSYIAALEGVSVNLVTGVAVGGASVGTDSFSGVNQVRGTSFADTLTGGLAANNNFESFEGRGGNDLISGGAGFDRADYAFDGASMGITINLAAGTVSGDAALTGTDTLLSIESVRGSHLSDSYNAIGFSGVSANAGSNGTFNEFEGMAGNDLITGNGNTRVTYSSAREAVSVNLATGTATGGASVGTDSFTGVNAARGSNFDDTLIGSTGNDSLLGGSGNDTLSGGNGNDTLQGDDGNDTIDGGAGFDTYQFGTPSGGGTVTVAAVGTITASAANQGTDTIVNVESVVGTSLADTYDATAFIGANQFEGTGGNDTILGNGQTQINHFRATSGVVVDLQAGTATGSSIGSDALSGVNQVSGSNFDDTFGGAGTNDTLRGNSGNDQLSGGAGNDLLDGGIGTDRASYASSSAGVTVDLSAFTASDGMGGTDTLLGIENVIGSAFDDALSGDGVANQLEGGLGGDTLVGGGGNDVLNGGVIADFQSAAGFIDIDTADYSAAAGAVDVNLATGTATDGEGGSDMLIGIERIVGSAFDDVFTGSGAFGERYLGGAGNDTIDGGLFNDRAEYMGATAGIAVNMTAISASSGTVTGDASVGTDTLIGVEQVIGTDFGDTYSALGYLSPSAPGGVASNFNEFEGAGGNDTITGNGGTRLSYVGALEGVTVNLVTGVAVGGASVGTDTFTGVNQVRGTNFADALIGGLAANVGFEGFEGRGGNDTINGGSGTDRADYAFDGAIGVGITVNLAAGTVTGDPVLTGTDTLQSIESVRGSFLDDFYDATGFSNVSANAGSNGTFNEFEGMAGNDTIVGNGGTRVTYASAREAVTVNIGAGTASGGASVGTDSFTGVVQARGSNFDDVIIGSAGSNFLLGGFGNDSMQGGVGNDTLQGDDGNDTIDGGADFDTYQFGTPSGGGTVTVAAGGTITASAANQGTDTIVNVEFVVGTSLADTYDATAFIGANQFEGTGGNDTILGNGQTRINHFRATTGVTVDLQAGTATGSSIGSDTLSGVNQVSGSNFDDVLSGAGTNDTLSGSTGNDQLSGGAGSDLLDGGVGTDRASYASSSAGVTVDLSAFTASDGMGGTDTLFLIENVAGSAFDDTLGGDGLANQLEGGLGGDTLVGRGGNDVLNGGVIADFQSAVGFNDLDTADYSVATGAVNVNLATGTASDGAGGTDTLSGIERIVGSAFDDTLTGSDTTFSERYVGGAGNDTINGGLFNDRAEYMGATAGIAVNMTSINASSGTVIGDASVGTDTLIGVEQVIGTAFADTYVAGAYLSPSGTAGANSNFNEFEGGGGNDSITGNGGTRVSFVGALEGVNVNLVTGTAIGGASVGTDTFTGVNQVRGTDFADTLVGGLAANNNFESFEGRAGNDLISGGVGFDRADYAFDGATSSGITVGLAAGTVSGDAALTGTDTLLSIESVRGSFQNDVYNAVGFSGVSLNAGSNGTFNEFEGLAGNDTVVGNGNTRLSYAGAREAVSVDMGAGLAVGGASVGTDTFSGVNTVRGSNFDDTLIGSSGNDTLEAQNGLDYLYGGLGADLIRSSGTGTDRIDYNALFEANDSIEQFTVGAGGDILDIADLLDASTSYADGAGGALADYCRVQASGPNGLLQIDTDGLGAGGWQTLATILGGSALDLNILLAGGNIDVFS